MIDLSSIYRNPVIPEEYYYVKVIHLETEDISGYAKPRILVRLKPWWEHELNDDVVLHAIIHSTEAARYHYVNFTNTFLRDKDEPLTKALNRWGCVRVHTATYGEAVYSSVKWIFQLPQVRQKVSCIEEEDWERQPYRRPSQPENYPGY